MNVPGNEKKNKLSDRILHITPVVSLLCIVFLTFANTVDDLDLWWHLKSGQVIYESHAIPGRDDFAYTSYPAENISRIGIERMDPAHLPSEEINRFLSSGFIKRNWLPQLLFYLVHLYGGSAGIGVLKSLLFAGALLVLYAAIIRNGGGRWAAFFVLCLVAYICRDFNYTRPQLFSFLFFACMLYALYDFKKGGKSAFLLPLLMILWANMHGGVILGVAIILVFAAAEIAKHLLHASMGIQKTAPLTHNRIRHLSLIVFLSSSASLISPAGMKTFLFPWILRNSLFGTIEEYHRPMLYEYHAYWVMLLLVAISAVTLMIMRRIDLTDLLISITVIAPSLMSNKYIIYFAMGTGVFLANAITQSWMTMKERDLYRKICGRTGLLNTPLQNALAVLPAAVSVITLITVIVSGNVLKFDTREKRYPSGAVTFIKETGLAGNMFNPFNWGGFLVWQLYPDQRVFMYGRAVNETAFYHYNQIISAANGGDHGAGRPLWERLLEAYNVNYILTGALTSAGTVVPLVDMIYVDRDWELIYQDGTSLIFLRTSENNDEMIRRHSLSKDRIYDEMISEGVRGIAETPATWGYYETLGFVYMKQNRFHEAAGMFEKYLSMNPQNQKVKEAYDFLAGYPG